MTTLQQAGIRGQSVSLANGTRVVLAGLDIPLQQLDHNSLGKVAGGASLSHWGCVVEYLHVILAEAQMKNHLWQDYEMNFKKVLIEVILELDAVSKTHLSRVISHKLNKALLNWTMTVSIRLFNTILLS